MFWQRCSWALFLAGLTHLPGFAQPAPPPSAKPNPEPAGVSSVDPQRKASDFMAFLEQARVLERGAEERLVVLLDTIPERWPSLPPPTVPYTGRNYRRVLAEASEVDVATANRDFVSFAKLPLEQRGAFLDQRPVKSDVALWVPNELARTLRAQSPGIRAVVLEAWFQWAESASRQDVLLLVASFSLELLSRSVSVSKLEECAAAWAELPFAESADTGAAALYSSQARILLRFGKIQDAIEANRKARFHFEGTGDELGQGQAWSGEALNLYLLGHHLEAITAYRRARSTFESADDLIGQGDSWRGEARLLTLLGKHQEALDSYRKARFHFEKAASPINEGDCWRGEADILLELGQAQEALEAYRNAQSSFNEAGDQLGQVESWKGVSRALVRLNQIQEGFEAFRKIRPLYENLGDLAGQGFYWLGEAGIHLLFGKNPEALDALKRAHSFYEIANLPSGQGDSLKGQAGILFRLGKNQEAIEVYRKARSLYQDSNNRNGQGATWVDEAEILSRLGKYQEAIVAYRKARSLYESTNYRMGQVNSLVGEARILVTLGKNQEALMAFRKARPIYEEMGNRIGQGNCWNGEADILFRLERYQEALETFRKARDLYESPWAQIGQGNSWKGEADILFRLERDQEALDAYRKARALYENAGVQVGQGSSWLGEADILLRLGKKREALAAYRRARSFYENSGYLLGEGKSWKGEARAQLDLRAFGEAALSARKAIAVWDVLREGFLDETARLGHHNSMAAAYDILVPALVELGSAPEAVAAAEEAKSRVLLDLIAARFPKSVQADEPFDFAQKRLELQTKLADLKGVDEQAEGLLEQAQAALDRELEQLAFENLLENRTTLLASSPSTLQELSALVAEVGPVIGFYVAEEETFGYLLLPQSTPVLFRAPLGRRYWLEKVTAAVDHLANENYKGAAEKDVRELWDQLFRPLAASLPKSGTLVVVPHGPLHQLPFETLTDPQGRRLFERFELSVVPSLATLAELRKRHRTSDEQDRLLALAAGRGLTLPENEIKAIGRLFNPKEAADFSAKLATFSTYEKLVARTRYLLVASHGIHVEGNLRQTYLEIEPSTNHDHRLSAAEIATIPIDAELVTLAACDTAVGKADLSDERLDLSRAFLVAGAAAVLATRWRLPDDPRTTQFLVDFYSAYRGVDGQKGKRKDEALNVARRLAIERGDPSAFWAAWVLIGDPQ